MLRKVVSTRTYRPERTSAGAFNIVDTLECGHRVTNKGSAGYANKRLCRHCTDMKSGVSRFSSMGDVIENWDPETEMPVRRMMTKRTGRDRIVPIREGCDPQYFMEYSPYRRYIDRRAREMKDFVCSRDDIKIAAIDPPEERRTTITSWLCEWCHNFGSKFIAEHPTECRVVWCHHCKTETWHHPIMKTDRRDRRYGSTSALRTFTQSD